jgi:hypothetical protein
MRSLMRRRVAVRSDRTRGLCSAGASAVMTAGACRAPGSRPASWIAPLEPDGAHDSSLRLSHVVPESAGRAA